MYEIESIVILERETFFSDLIDDVYDLYFNFEDGLDVDFEIHFKFTFKSEHLNTEQLAADGFTYFRTAS